MPTVTQVAALGARLPTTAAPSSQRTNSSVLAASVDGVFYPNWEPQFGWKAVGLRTDRVDGRYATTVFYARQAQTLSYTIVSGTALPAPKAASQTPTGIRAITLSDKRAVTWQRHGHTCVLAGAGTDQALLVNLAAWNGDHQGAYG